MRGRPAVSPVHLSPLAAQGCAQVCSGRRRCLTATGPQLSWIAPTVSYCRTVGLPVCLSVCCLTSQQHASVSQGRICSDNFTCCHTEIEVADPTLHLTQSQYTDTGPTSPSTEPITSGAWQGSCWSANF